MDIVQAYLQISPDPSIWLVQVFLVVLATVSCNFLLMRLIDLAEKIVARTESIWDDALLEAARIPVRLTVWLLGISIAATLLKQVGPNAFLDLLPELRRVVFIFIGALFLTRLISHLEVNLLDPARVSKPMDQTTATLWPCGPSSGSRARMPSGVNHCRATCPCGSSQCSRVAMACCA